MSDNLLSGRWPRQGADKDQIRRKLKECLEGNADWGETTILGFPSMSPHPFGLEAFRMFQERHTNTILTHTRGKGEKGFDGAKIIEREVVFMVGDLLGASLNEMGLPDIDGYITSGGTEGNIMGIWIGREKLLSEIRDDTDRRVAVLASPASHYSLRKACALTGLGEGSWDGRVFIPARDGNGLNFVRCNERGEIDVEALEAEIHVLRNKGLRRFIVFLNEGATLTGAMDNTALVGSLTERLRSEWKDGVGFYLHVDAAYGAFIYPFLDPDGQWSFRVPQVESVTADPYKMGQAPLAQGVFLCRKNLQRYIERRTGYVQNQMDDTLIGSRSGANAAACYAIFRSEGSEGFIRMWREVSRNADYLLDLLTQAECVEAPLRILNVVSFRLPDSLEKATLESMEKRVINPFHVMWDLFNPDPENPESRLHRVVKCNITRDVKREWLDSFVNTINSTLC